MRIQLDFMYEIPISCYKHKTRSTYFTAEFYEKDTAKAKKRCLEIIEFVAKDLSKVIEYDVITYSSKDETLHNAEALYLDLF